MSSLSNNLKEKGYAVLKDVVAHETCDALRERINYLLEAYEDKIDRTIFSTLSHAQARNQYFYNSGDNISFFWEEDAFNEEGALVYPKNKAINKIGHGLHRHDPVFRKFAESSLVREIIEESGFFEQALIAQSMYIFKQAGIGGEVICHQDSTFIQTKPNKVLGVWFALEEATEENGCLWGIPGKYKGQPNQLFSLEGNECVFRPKENYNYPLEQAVSLPVTKGSVILFHGLFPHFSYPNKSNQSRHALTFHVIDKTGEYLKSNWNQSSYLFS